jgi:MoaA/NifB/PqqE/SkfB family radical SAM enzyme
MKPTRVIFNYSARCNMACTFCYVPFNGEKAPLSDKLAYLDRLKALGTELITFGGGDPLMDPHFPDLVSHAATLGLTIQLDTNGLCLSAKNLPLIRDHVSFMSLPLEGPAETHTLMRGHQKHFQHVLSWLPRLLDAEVRVKINTVASLPNIDALPRLAEILSPFCQRQDNPLARWSIYEFIPAESGERHRADYELPAGHFAQAMARLMSNFPDLPIEPGSRSQRKSAYFFMNDRGAVYISDPSPIRDSAVFIGHVLEQDIGETWSRLVTQQDQGKSFNDRATIRIDLGR